MRRLLAVVTVILSSLAVGLSVNSSPATAALPGGFTDTAIPASAGNPLSGPTTIVALNGGRALVLEKSGAVRVVLADGTLWSEDALNLSVCSGGEMGLLGAAVDPEFQSNGYIYLYYTRSAGDCSSSSGRANRVSRFTMSANSVVAASESILLDNIPATGGNHNGGDLDVGQDGNLYVAIGDAGKHPRGAAGSAAQDLSLLTGKIVRIDTAGGVPAGNPFVGDPNAISCAFAGLTAPTNGRCLEIFSWGLRNPYRFAFDSNSGATRFFINDVGQGTWEEVDEGGSGRDYGWSSREGACVNGSSTNCPPPPAGVTDPLTSYSHSATGCTYITAGAFVPDGVWPKQFDGSYLFADGGCNKIWQRTNAGAVDYATPFHQVTGGIVDMTFVIQGPDPALFYVTFGNSQIRKITYDAPPATTSPALAYTPLPTAKRAYDTRNNIGVSAGKVRANSTRLVSLQIADPAVKAALVNITMDGPVGAAHVVASQPRTEYPSTSNVNAAPSEIVANASIVPVDPDGNLQISVSGTTHVIIDVMGTFKQVDAAQPGGRYTALAPQRLIDTREPASTSNDFTRVAAGSASTVTTRVTGRLGTPSTVTAVALIVTGVSAAASNPGFVTVFPRGGTLPSSSNLNVNGKGDIRPNLVVVPVGANGAVDAYLYGTDDIVIDVAGYFAEASTGAGLYHMIAPSRQVDSRSSLGFGTIPTNNFGMFNPAGAVPPAAVAISQNVTVTNPRGAGFITAWPGYTPLNLASNANSSGPNQDRAALTLTQRGGGGFIFYYSSSGTDLVVDVTGYFD